jgi:N-acetylmuramoyl-L-alanine amidase
MKRETANFSADFSQSLLKRLGKATEMSRVPRRSAAFKVLKQTHAPSVLIELGYVSNKSDEQEMTTKSWRQKVAAAITAAVQAYFKKRTAQRH